MAEGLYPATGQVEGASSSEPQPSTASSSHTNRRARRKNLGSVLPGSSESECAAAWGDGLDSNTERLLRDVPPHW